MRSSGPDARRRASQIGQPKSDSGGGYSAAMAVPQFGIFAQGTIAHEFIEFDVRPDVDLATAAAMLQQIRQPAVSAGGVNLVVAFGSDFWQALAPDHAPPELAPFRPIGTVGGHHAPATQH